MNRATKVLDGLADTLPTDICVFPIEARLLQFLENCTDYSNLSGFVDWPGCTDNDLKFICIGPHPATPAIVEELS